MWIARDNKPERDDNLSVTISKWRNDVLIARIERSHITHDNKSLQHLQDSNKSDNVDNDQPHQEAAIL